MKQFLSNFLILASSLEHWIHWKLIKLTIVKKNSYELHSFSHSSHTQEARNSFFGLGLNLLKSKFSIDDKL